MKNIRFIFLCVVLVPILVTANDKCLKNGIYEHPTDCDKFFSCAPFGPVLMHCPSGLHFNPQYLVCDWPQDGGCRRSQDTENLLQSCPIYPHPKDCTKFYLCSSSGPTLRNCPYGLNFNPQLLVCDWPHNVECAGSITSTTGYPVTTTRRTTKEPVISSENNAIYSDGVSTLGILETSKSTVQPDIITSPVQQVIKVTNSQNKNVSAPAVSSPIKSNSTYLCKSSIWPHPSDCTKYFMCGSTGAVEKFCPENLFFNPILLICDWPYNVRCKMPLNDITEITTTEHRENASSITPITTSSLETTTIIENISESITIPEYFQITSIHDLVNITTANVIYDEEHNETTVITEENVTTSEIPQSPETTMYDSTTESTTIFKIIENQLCEGSIWPHQDDCTKFYMCGSTGTVEKICPKDMHFNPSLLICDWPYEAGCKANMTEITTIQPKEDVTNYSEIVSTENVIKYTNITENLPTTEDLKEITTENIVSTSSYGETTLTIEENTTKEHNITTQSIDTAFDSTTYEFSTTFHSNYVTEPCEGSIWPHPHDCTKYFMCGDTGTVEMVCPEELHFNPLLLICDWPLNVQCNESITATSDISTMEPLTGESTTTQIIPSEMATTDLIFSSSITPDREYSETTITESLNKITTENILSLDEHIETTISIEEKTQDLTNITTDDLGTTFFSTSKFTTTIQSTASSELCKSSSWPHPSDCTKYFVCGATGAVEMICPDELHFNRLLLVCDWPLNVKCHESLNTSSDISTTELIPTSTLDRELQETTTIESFDKITTEYKLSLDEHIGTTIYTEENATQEFATVTTERPGTTSVSTTELTTTFQSTDSSKLCKGDSWPHPKDCSKYFMCGATGAIEKVCPEQLHFNPILLICDWPLNAQCSEYLGTSSEISTTELSTDETSTIQTTLGLDENTSTINTEYLETTINDDLDNTTIENILSSSEHIEIIADKIETTERSEPPFVPTTDHTIDHTEQCKSSIWPHPIDCTKFFMCDSTGAVEMLCPDQMHFNRVLLVCDSPYNARCNEFLSTHETTTIELTTEIEGGDSSSTTSSNYSYDLWSDVTTDIGNDFHDIVTTDHSTSSNIVYLETTIKEWPASNTTENLIAPASDSQTETADLSLEDETKKPFTSIIQKPENSVGSTLDPTPLFLSMKQCEKPIYPHLEDCQKFFICDFNGPVEMSCPEGLHFNPAWLTCDWPRNAGCKSGFMS